MKTPDQKIEELENRINVQDAKISTLYSILDKVSEHIKMQLETNNQTGEAIKLIASLFKS